MYLRRPYLAKNLSKRILDCASFEDRNFFQVKNFPPAVKDLVYDPKFPVRGLWYTIVITTICFFSTEGGLKILIKYYFWMIIDLKRSIDFG